MRFIADMASDFMNDNRILLFFLIPIYFGLIIALFPVATKGFSCFLTPYPVSQNICNRRSNLQHSPVTARFSLFRTAEAWQQNPSPLRLTSNNPQNLQTQQYSPVLMSRFIGTGQCIGCRFCEIHCPDFAITVSERQLKRRKGDAFIQREDEIARMRMIVGASLVGR